jgi:ATP-dependent 26S proteasome regulatory subunit
VQDIRYELLARLCPNSTGAEIRSVCTEAGMFAIRARRKVQLSSYLKGMSHEIDFKIYRKKNLA